MNKRLPKTKWSSLQEVIFTLKTKSQQIFWWRVNLQGLTQNAEQIMINWKQLVATTSTQNQPHPDISVHFPTHNTLQAIKTADLSEENTNTLRKQHIHHF